MPEPPKRPARPSQAPRVSTSRPIGGRTSQVDRAMALRDAVAEAVEAEQSFKKKTAVRHTNGRLIAMAVIAAPLVAFAAYTWIARPAFIWGPPMVMAPAEADANLRTAMYFVGMRIDAYKAEHGYYPASLEAIGESLPGVAYEVVDSVFELRAVVNRQLVVFRPDVSADEYLGTSKDIISSRRRGP